MARATFLYSTNDQNIIAASRAYCAEVKALKQLYQQYPEYDTIPGHLLGTVKDRMRRARQRALLNPPATMSGVMALVRMAQADGLLEVDPVAATIIRGLLRIHRSPKTPGLSRRSRLATMTCHCRETSADPADVA